MSYWIHLWRSGAKEQFHSYRSTLPPAVGDSVVINRYPEEGAACYFVTSRRIEVLEYPNSESMLDVSITVEEQQDESR